MERAKKETNPQLPPQGDSVVPPHHPAYTGAASSATHGKATKNDNLWYIVAGVLLLLGAGVWAYFLYFAPKGDQTVEIELTSVSEDDPAEVKDGNVENVCYSFSLPEKFKLNTDKSVGCDVVVDDTSGVGENSLTVGWVSDEEEGKVKAADAFLEETKKAVAEDGGKVGTAKVITVDDGTKAAKIDFTTKDNQHKQLVYIPDGDVSFQIGDEIVTGYVVSGYVNDANQVDNFSTVVDNFNVN